MNKILLSCLALFFGSANAMSPRAKAISPPTKAFSSPVVVEVGAPQKDDCHLNFSFKSDKLKELAILLDAKIRAAKVHGRYVEKNSPPGWTQTDLTKLAKRYSRGDKELIQYFDFIGKGESFEPKCFSHTIQGPGYDKRVEISFEKGVFEIFAGVAEGDAKRLFGECLAELGFEGSILNELLEAANQELKGQNRLCFPADFQKEFDCRLYMLYLPQPEAINYLLKFRKFPEGIENFDILISFVAAKRGDMRQINFYNVV